LVRNGNRKTSATNVAPESKFMLKIRLGYIGMAKGEVALQGQSERVIKAAWGVG